MLSAFSALGNTSALAHAQKAERQRGARRLRRNLPGRSSRARNEDADRAEWRRERWEWRIGARESSQCSRETRVGSLLRALPRALSNERKAGVTRDTRLQTGRHTLRSGGQIHGHPSTHSPANSMGTLRSSPSRVRPGNGRAPRYSTHLDRSDATSSSNLVISFRGRSHTIHSPSLTCFQDDVLAGVSCLVLSR